MSFNSVGLAGLAAALVMVPASLEAQTRDTANALDRIVAVVGTKTILSSQLQERLFTELQGRETPKDPKVLRQLLETIRTSLVDDELVVQEAQRDTMIKVIDEEVTQSVDELYRNIHGKFKSEEQFRADLQRAGFQTLEEWRSYSSDQQRRKFLGDRFWQRLNQSQKIKELPPTDNEVREYFDQNKTSFPPRSEGVSFRQVIVGPKPSEEAKASARRVADSILVELRKGGDFATAARRFSMDPATKEQGGSLNWIRRGQGYDPKFEEAAFSLRPGQISDPVESSFGYHLIQVERVQPAEVSVRHILLSPVIDSVNADSARRVAEAVYVAIKAGASFDSLQRLYHDKIEEREVNQLPLDQLARQAPPYAEALRDVKQGELAPLFRLDSPDPNRAKFAVVQVTSRIPAGETRFEDVRDQIRNRLATVLGRRKHLDRLRHATFVEVRPL